MIKIAFFDVDGTLLKIGSKAPSKLTIETLQKLQENGVLICMATGRGYPSVPHFEGITFDVLLTFNGSYVRNAEEVIFKNPLKEEEKMRIIENLKGMNRAIAISDEKMILTFNGSYVRNAEEVIFKNPLKEEEKMRIIENLKGMNRAIAISDEKMIVTNGTDEILQQYFDFGNVEMIISEDFDELCRGDIYQIMCACRKEEYDRILDGTVETQITAWWEEAGDIIPITCGKGNAVKAVLEFYGLTREEAIAFGDGRNDVEMLEAVGTGVAMANAKEDVKAYADEICGSVEDDGVYHYCLEHQLIS